MDECFDKDAEFRALACSINQWFHDYHGTCPETLSDFAHEAMVLEDYIQDGGTLMVSVDGSLSKCVRGGE